MKSTLLLDAEILAVEVLAVKDDSEGVELAVEEADEDVVSGGDWTWGPQGMASSRSAA